MSEKQPKRAGKRPNLGSHQHYNEFKKLVQQSDEELGQTPKESRFGSKRNSMVEAED